MAECLVTTIATAAMVSSIFWLVYELRRHRKLKSDTLKLLRDIPDLDCKLNAFGREKRNG